MAWKQLGHSVGSIRQNEFILIIYTCFDVLLENIWTHCIFDKLSLKKTITKIVILVSFNDLN